MMTPERVAKWHMVPCGGSIVVQSSAASTARGG
ncbi:MAG: hypothetical protein QOF81_3397, partial [Acidimicrobiaceae bacterium]|nr:hypothetical protein [Acidimicrobiaceae bacterium]